MTGSSNGNVNDNYLTDDYDGPPVDCDVPPADRAALAYCAQAATRTRAACSARAGFGLQLTESHDLFGWTNQGIVGADYSDSDDTFDQALPVRRPSRPTARSSTCRAPSTIEKVISLGGTNRIPGVYLTDTLSPSGLLHVTASVRYNRNTETLDGYSIDTDVGDPAPTSISRPVIGQPHLQPAQSRDRLHDHAERRRHLLRELQRGQPRADRHRARLRQSRSSPAACRTTSRATRPLKQVVARTVEIGARGNLVGPAAHLERRRCSAPSTATTSSSSPRAPTPASSTTSATRAGRASTWRSAARPAVCTGASPTASSTPPINRASRSTPNPTARPTRRQHRGAARRSPAADSAPHRPADRSTTSSRRTSIVGGTLHRHRPAPSCTATRTTPTRPAARTRRATSSRQRRDSRATRWSTCRAPTTSEVRFDLSRASSTCSTRNTRPPDS